MDFKNLFKKNSGVSADSNRSGSAQANNKEADLKNFPKADSNKIVPAISNWYADRYYSVIIQRNFLIILLILCVIGALIATYVVGNVTSTFKIQPFVIEVEEKTGLTNIVNPLTHNEITANEVLNKYFLMKYIKAREGYNIETYRYNYFTVTRLMSAPSVYGGFKWFVNNSPDSPLALYGNLTSINVVFRSLQFFPPDSTDKTLANNPKAVIRFTLFADKGNLREVTGNRVHKIVTLTYKYEQTEMNEDERSENPLGFFVTSYRADIENVAPPTSDQQGE